MHTCFVRPRTRQRAGQIATQGQGVGPRCSVIVETYQSYISDPIQDRSYPERANTHHRDCPQRSRVSRRF